MKHHENERLFIESIFNLDKQIEEAKQTIKESFNIDIKFDNETNSVYILNENDPNSIKAKDYLLEHIGSDKIQILYGY